MMNGTVEPVVRSYLGTVEPVVRSYPGSWLPVCSGPKGLDYLCVVVLGGARSLCAVTDHHCALGTGESPTGLV